MYVHICILRSIIHSIFAIQLPFCMYEQNVVTYYLCSEEDVSIHKKNDHMKHIKK